MALSQEIYLQRILNTLLQMLPLMNSPQTFSSMNSAITMPTQIGMTGTITVDETKVSKNQVVTVLTVDVNYTLKYDEGDE